MERIYYVFLSESGFCNGTLDTDTVFEDENPRRMRVFENPIIYYGKTWNGTEWIDTPSE